MLRINIRTAIPKLSKTLLAPSRRHIIDGPTGPINLTAIPASEASSGASEREVNTSLERRVRRLEDAQLNYYKDFSKMSSNIASIRTGQYFLSAIVLAGLTGGGGVFVWLLQNS